MNQQNKTTKDREIELLKCRISKLEKYLLHLMRATRQVSMMAGYSLEKQQVDKRIKV